MKLTSTTLCQTDLGNKVAELGGQHEYDLTPKTTHLIVGEYETTKYRHVAKSRPDIRPMAVGWVDAVRNLWVSDDPINFRALEKRWTLKTFETGGGAMLKSGEADQPSKLTCCISGMDKEERDEWIPLIEANGGRYSGQLDRNVTHLIISEPTGKKYLAARRWEQKIVVPQWIRDSATRGMILDEGCYDPHLPREDIGKGAWTKRENRRKSLGKRLREAAEAQNENGRRKLRKTASMKLNSQRENMWGEILAQQHSADQSGASLLAEEPTQPLPSDSMLRHHSEQVSVKDSLGGLNEGPNGIFASCLFYIFGFPTQHVNVLVEYITSRGGIMAASLENLKASKAVGRCFVVVPQASDPKSHPAVSDDVEVITDFFIEKCVYKTGTALPDSKAHVIGRPFPVFPIESFDKLSICTSGFTELDLLHISKVVRQLGARYEERFTAQCSILVCTSLGAVRKQKLDMALAFGTPVVRADWLWECISQGKKLPCQEFVFPELKSRKLKALPNKSLTRSKSSSEMSKKLTPKSMTGRAESSTRTSLPGPDMSAFDDTPLVSTDPPDSSSQSRERVAVKESNLTPDFDTAPTHQNQSDTGSQQLPSRPVNGGELKPLSEWSASDINQAHTNDQPPSQPSRKPLARVRSEICDSEAGDDDGFADFADADDATAQTAAQMDDPVQLEKRRVQQQKAEKAAAERKALSNKLTTLLEGTGGDIGTRMTDSSVSGAAVDPESSRIGPGPPPTRRKRNLIGRVISNTSVASSVSQEQESSIGRSGVGMGRTHSAVIHEDDSPDEDETTAAGPAATQIEYADPEAVLSKDKLRKKMLKQTSTLGGAGSVAYGDEKITMGGLQESAAAAAGVRSMRRR